MRVHMQHTLRQHTYTLPVYDPIRPTNSPLHLLVEPF